MFEEQDYHMEHEGMGVGKRIEKRSQIIPLGTEHQKGSR